MFPNPLFLIRTISFVQMLEVFAWILLAQSFLLVFFFNQAYYIDLRGYVVCLRATMEW
jgi:hypothetical protein